MCCPSREESEPSRSVSAAQSVRVFSVPTNHDIIKMYRERKDLHPLQALERQNARLKIRSRSIRGGRADLNIQRCLLVCTPSSTYMRPACSALTDSVLKISSRPSLFARGKQPESKQQRGFISPFTFLSAKRERAEMPSQPQKARKKMCWYLLKCSVAGREQMRKGKYKCSRENTVEWESGCFLQRYLERGSSAVWVA